MPTAERPGGARSTAPGTRSGGTSVAEEGGGFGIWIAAVGGLAVAGGVALLLLQGDGGNEVKPESAKPAVETAEADVGDEVAPPPAPGDSPAEPDDREVPFGDVDERNERNGVAVGIDRALDARRLWSNVDVNGLNLEISSAYCAEEGMRAEVEEFAEDLSATGFELVQCRERHGPLVFELRVSELSGGAAPADATDAGAS